MRALVISGGGSKGAFAGGVAEHLIRVQGRKYDLYLGSSTGSLLVSHLDYKLSNYKMFSHLRKR
jgi:predicted patatin/cPLA2 family phospholipase